MKLSRSVAAATILLSSIASVFADDQIKAQPITLSAAVGNEQSDFFITEAKVPLGGGSVDILAHLMFTAQTKVLTNGNEHRALFKQKLERNSPSVVFYSTVNAQAPLKKLNTFVVPQGTVFTNFQRNRNRIGPRQGRKQQFFRIPGKGLYQSTGGATAVLVKAEAAANPISGYSFRAEDRTATNTDKEEQFRVLLGATTPAKGYEPYISTGTALGTKLLKDIVPGATGSFAQQFTRYFFPATATEEAFWVGNDPESGGNAAVFRSSVQVAPRSVKYGVETVGANFGFVPNQLTGTSAGLFFTGTPSGEAGSALFRYDEVTSAFVRVSTAAHHSFTQLTANADEIYGNIGFRARDVAAGVDRFGRYSSQTLLFPELTNAVGIRTTNPEKITSTGNYYYYTAVLDGGFRVLVRWFTGGSTVDIVTNTIAGNPIYDVSEICYVALDSDSQDASNGELYFVGGSFFGVVYVPNVLFKMDPNRGDGIAVPVRTTSGNLVTGAKNLRSVRNSSIARLYFCAPVNGTTNAEFAAGGTDYGTKPWVVNAE